MERVCGSMLNQGKTDHLGDQGVQRRRTVVLWRFCTSSHRDCTKTVLTGYKDCLSWIEEVL